MHKRLTQICLGVSRSLWQSMGCLWPAARLGALSVAAHEWDILKEVTIIFIISPIVWPQVKQQGGNTFPPPQPHQQKIELKIY